MTCVYYSFWSGIECGFEVYENTRKWAGFVPTNDGLTLVGTYFPMAEYDRMASATQEDRLYGTGDQRNFFRRAAGPGWALVGDAGHHKDSLTGKGITDAFRQATALAECVGDGLLEVPWLDRALDRYAASRDALLMEGYRDTLAAAEFRPGRRLPLMRAIVDDPEMTARFFSTISGVLPSSELMTPELRARTGV